MLLGESLMKTLQRHRSQMGAGPPEKTRRRAWQEMHMYGTWLLSEESMARWWLVVGCDDADAVSHLSTASEGVAPVAARAPWAMDAHTLTTYEVTRVVQWRVKELREGRAPLVPTSEDDDFISVALGELRAGLLRYDLFRRLPNGCYSHLIVHGPASSAASSGAGAREAPRGASGAPRPAPDRGSGNAAGGA